LVNAAVHSLERFHRDDLIRKGNHDTERTCHSLHKALSFLFSYLGPFRRRAPMAALEQSARVFETQHQYHQPTHSAKHLQMVESEQNPKRTYMRTSDINPEDGGERSKARTAWLRKTQVSC
jgi:hypothetical protein